MIRKLVACTGNKTALWSLVFLLLTVLPSNLTAQTGETKGVVRDAAGQPVPNVNVMLKDGKSGTITDAKGAFTLKDLPTGALLVISGVGYETQEVALEGRRTLNITLQQDAASLDDVVVVGYGRQRKVTKTGAVSEIKGDDIRRTPSASLQNTLQGRLPGFFSVQRSGRPGADGADFFIRGISTFAENSQQPYILVDDIEYSYAQFSRIDPNEVENITILKDAATTAIYGIKGANGVILVTTRRGKVGKPVITFRSQLGAQVPVKPFKFLNSYETALLRNESLVNEGLQPQFSQADLDAFRDGTDPYRHPNVNWYEELIRKYTLQAQQNVDISGGSERAKYFISMGYLSQNGIVKDFQPPSIYEDDNINNNYYYKRYNFRSNLDIAATDRLNLKLDVSGNFDERNGPSGVGNGIFYDIAHYEQLPPYAYNIYNPDGTYGFSDGLLVPKPAEGNSNNVVGRIAMGGYSRNYGNQFNFNLSGIQKLDQLLPGLSARVTTAFTSTNTATRSLSRGGGFPAFAYNPLTNTYLPRDINVFRVSPLTLSYAGGSPVRNLTMQGSLNYDRTFGAHGVNALFLYNQTSQYFSTGDRNTNYIPSKLRGFTFRTAYNFRQKYMLELNGALNGTDRFVTQERYGFFPAVSVGYNLAKEGWVQKNLPVFDVLKLRGSWGLVGDDGVSAGSRYLYEEIYNRTLGMAYFGETPNALAGIREGTLGNDDVSWQKERKTNVALDFSLWNGLFSGSVDVFDNFRYDILRARNTVPIYFGIATVPPVNLGKVKNRGYEVELTHRHKIGKLGYSLRGTLSFAKNTIVEIDEPPAKYPWLKQTGTSIGTTRMWMWDGFYQNQADIDTSAKPSGVIRPGFLKYRDLNGDKIINDDDRMFYGEPNIPNTNYGINLTLNYKGFSMNALFQGATGYNFNVGWRLATPFKANLSELHQKRWTPAKGNDAEFPLLISNFNATYMSPTDNQISTFWSMRSSYLRFRSLELGWDIPTGWLSRVKLSSARFTLSGYNLWTWSNVFRKYQYDPETVGNVAADVYPQQRLYNAGLNITFK
jgi:TonB-linked SusC/RagA family outer membrane protein